MYVCIHIEKEEKEKSKWIFLLDFFFFLSCKPRVYPLHFALIWRPLKRLGIHFITSAIFEILLFLAVAYIILLSEDSLRRLLND